MNLTLDELTEIVHLYCGSTSGVSTYILDDVKEIIDKRYGSEPNGGNINRPHPLMVNSGTFWRCAHGNTGMSESNWIGCKECDALDNDGWVTVPLIPTEAMCIAGVEEAPLCVKKMYAHNNNYTGQFHGIDSEQMADLYKALIAAAPKKP